MKRKGYTLYSILTTMIIVVIFWLVIIQVSDLDNNLDLRTALDLPALLVQKK